MSSRKITLFLANGLPKGVRSVNIDQWSGRAVAGPRNKMGNIVDLFEKTGGGSCVYFLIGKSEDGGLPLVYVGESDKIIARIKQHDAKKDWWEDLVIFFSPDGSLTTTGSKYLESICVSGLQLAGRCILQNSVTPAARKIPYEDEVGFHQFYENISLLLPLLGYDILVGEVNEKKDVEREMFFLTRKGVDAKAFLREDGQMEVLKGSTAVAEVTHSFSENAYKPLRDDLLKIGKLMKEGDILRFANDYTFSSPSAAAAVILGNAANGKVEWKSKIGETLKEIFD